jgi:hypothetical protein
MKTLRTLALSAFTLALATAGTANASVRPDFGPGPYFINESASPNISIGWDGTVKDAVRLTNTSTIEEWAPYDFENKSYGGQNFGWYMWNADGYGDCQEFDGGTDSLIVDTCEPSRASQWFLYEPDNGAFISQYDFEYPNTDYTDWLVTTSGAKGSIIYLSTVANGDQDWVFETE